MIVRQIITTLIMSVVLVFAGDAFATSRAPQTQTKFESDLQSLLGAVVQTKNGEMLIRQSKDDEGRVRKQILIGPDFREIQLDQDADGTVDFWEVTRGSKTVEASHPNRGRFLRLVVTDRFSEGMQESTYLLNLNSRGYTLLKTKFMGKKVRFKSESDDSVSFEPVDSRQSLQVPQTLSEIPVARDLNSADERFALQDSDWIQRQSEILGTDITCEENTTSSRLAELQREWWKILNSNADTQENRLAEALKTSRLFDSSCKTPKADFDKITKALSTVMMTSSKGSAHPLDGTRGRYLRCLEQSGLGVTAAKMEASFLSGYSDRRADAPFTCEWKPGAGGLNVPAEAYPSSQQVRIFMTGADEAKRKADRPTDKTKDGSLQNYQNVLFHEMIHIAGIVDEDIAHAAQACCGDSTDSRIKACNKLDVLVTREKRLIDIETHIDRVSEGTLTFITALETQFGATTANQLNREFKMGLDSLRDSEYPNGIFSDSDYSRCVANSSEERCREVWEKAVRKYADTFFSKQCPKIVPGAYRKNCKIISSSVRDEVAGVIARSMIDTPRNHGTDPSGLSGAPVNCADRKKIRAQLNRSSGSVAVLLNFVFGRSVEAVDEDECDGAIGVPVATNPATSAGNGRDEVTPVQSGRSYGVGAEVGLRSVSVPGSAATGATAGTSGRTNDSVGNTKPSRNSPSRSPLPVTRVDSGSDARSVAEDRYRRATDFVGSASRGLERVRDALLPAAVAAAETATTKRPRGRLAPNANFVAFKAEKGEKIVVSLDNPFAAKRGLASVTGAGAEKSDGASSGRNGSRDGGSASSSSSGGRPNAIGSGAEASKADSNQVAGGSNAKSKRKGAGAEAGEKSNAGAAAANAQGAGANGKVGGNDKAEKQKADAALTSLFILPYRQIEPRLNQVGTVEMLISSKISIRDAQNRLVGSGRPSTCYEYAQQDRPLRRLATCERPSE